MVRLRLQKPDKAFSPDLYREGGGCSHTFRQDEGPDFPEGVLAIDAFARRFTGVLEPDSDISKDVPYDWRSAERDMVRARFEPASYKNLRHMNRQYD
ncbi:MAG: hypothetical protein ABII07_00220 [Patescibacteria group bacterium]|nr:hypothetical protein [Patescibacteria group bacterium]